MALHLIRPGDPPPAFPSAEGADAHGLVAVGGDLAPARLLAAYRRGIFPWYGPGQPILWWSPEPRAILLPEALHVARSLRRTIRRRALEVTFDRDFGAVLAGCAAPRREERGTWITPAMARAYQALHDAGCAHSVEVREGGALVGGLYGVALGGVFFGESMFSRAPDGSKAALVGLCARLAAWRFALVDCQFLTPHLASMGAIEVGRREFLGRLAGALALPDRPGPWSA